MFMCRRVFSEVLCVDDPLWSTYMTGCNSKIYKQKINALNYYSQLSPLKITYTFYTPDVMWLSVH